MAMITVLSEILKRKASNERETFEEAGRDVKEGCKIDTIKNQGELIEKITCIFNNSFLSHLNRLCKRKQSNKKIR